MHPSPFRQGLRLAALLMAMPLLALAATQPNIVFILADDLGYADIGFNGSRYFETPRIDALGAESLALDPAPSPAQTTTSSSNF